jgi:hypothetical protein
MWAVLFWAVALFTANSTLGLVRALVDSDWYAAKARASGVEPNFQRLIVAKVVGIGAGGVDLLLGCFASRISHLDCLVRELRFLCAGSEGHHVLWKDDDRDRSQKRSNLN